MLLQKNTNREDPAVHLALDTHNNDPYNTITNGGVCRTIRGTTTTTSASQATTIVMPTTATTGMMTPTVGVSVDSVDDQNYLVPRSATNVVLA